MSAAAKAIRMDKTAKVTVYEKTDVVSWGACGMPYYVGGFYDDAKNMLSRTPEEFAKSGIDLHINHEVLAVDSKNKTIKVKNLKTGEEFTDSYDTLFVATGSRAAMPPIENITLNNICTLKKFDDSLKLRKILDTNKNIKNTLVVGAGFIGIEVAHAFHHLGKNVRIIEMTDHILGEVFDIEISQKLAEHIKEKNIALNFEEKVLKFEGDENGNVKSVVTDKGKYDCDLVLIATGEKPNTEFIKDTGIALYKNGAIVIDQECKTSIDSIYAAGDCATVYHAILNEQTYIPLATTANKLGRMVASNLLGGHDKFAGTFGSACILIFDIEAARTGITEKQAHDKNIEVKTTTITDKDHTSQYPNQEDITIKLVYQATTRKILGGQVFGKRGAVLRCDVIAACIKGGLTVEDLGMLDLCYAPPFARTWDALNVAGNASK